MRSTIVHGKLTHSPGSDPSAWVSAERSRFPLAGRLSQLTSATGGPPAAARARRARASRPITVRGGRSVVRSARNWSSSSSRPAPSIRYAFSVTVRVTTRVAGSASRSSAAVPWVGRCRAATSEPTTSVRGGAADSVVTLNSPSCSLTAVTTSALRGATATMPQSPPCARSAASV